MLAGDHAGRVLEEQLAAAIQRERESAQLLVPLAEARALAEREHQRAERISAEVLELVEAQSAIGRELQKMIAGVERERRGQPARRAGRGQSDLAAKKRLLEENEDLSKRLNEAWAKAKLSDELREEARAAKQTIDEQQVELNRLLPLVTRQEARIAELGAVEASLQELKKKDQLQTAGQAELEARLKSAIASHQQLEEKVEVLQSENSSLSEKVIAQRAEALRERILRKRVETQLEDAAAGQAGASPAAEEAEDRAAEAALLDIAPIYFGKSQADSEAQERSLIAQVTEIHQRFPDARFRISGHTCTDGDAANNLALSQRRARRVAELLKSNGIPVAAIAGVVGKGESAPIADNASQQGREANRRVEIEVLRE